MKTIYLIRHCESTGQENNASLTNNWIKSSHKLSVFLEDKWIEQIISSPYKRAINSIKPLSEKINIKIELDNNLIEKVLSSEKMDDWMEKLEKSFTDLNIKYKWWESSKEAKKRSQIPINNALNNKTNTIAIVTHWALMTLILKYFDNKIWFNEWKNLTNPDIYKIEISKDKQVKFNRLKIKASN